MVLALVLTLAACAGGPRMRGDLRPTANPSAVIAAELGFARMAQDKGQWTAFAEYAADDAVMFVPEPVEARKWLGKQKDPPEAVRWQPHQVWSSCDGSLAVTRGAWQRTDGTVGTFTTVWQRQKNGDYKWVLDTGAPLGQPLPAPEMIAADVGICGRPPVEVTVADGPLRFAAYHWQKTSDDRTLGAEVILNRDHKGDLTFTFAEQAGHGIASVPINGD